MRNRHWLVTLLAVLPLAVSMPSCALWHSSRVPDFVETMTETRVSVWEAIETGWPATEVQLLAALEADLEAFTQLDDETTGFTAPAAYKVTVQSQKIAVETAIPQLDSYTAADKLALVRVMLRTWRALDGYFDDKTPTTPGG